MIFGVSPTRNAVVIAQATGTSETFSIKAIRTVEFQARCGGDLKDLQQRLVAIFDRGKRRRSTIALLGSSSGRFKSSVEAIKAEAVVELAAAESGLPVVKVRAASLKEDPRVPGGGEVAGLCRSTFESHRAPQELVARRSRRGGRSPQGGRG